jgi:predicted membrane metal-binding protein
VGFFRIHVHCAGDFIYCHNKKHIASNPIGQYEAAHKVISRFQTISISNINAHFPSPHSELLIGLLLGLDEIKHNRRFNDVLRETGTIHVAVVSGYNISLFFVVLSKFVGSQYRPRNFILTAAMAFIYAVMTGFGAPVIRAWIMTVVVFFGKLYGRNLNVVRVLLWTGLLMILLSPATLFSLFPAWGTRSV